MCCLVDNGDKLNLSAFVCFDGSEVLSGDERNLGGGFRRLGEIVRTGRTGFK